LSRRLRRETRSAFRIRPYAAAMLLIVVPLLTLEADARGGSGGHGGGARRRGRRVAILVNPHTAVIGGTLYARAFETAAGTMTVEPIIATVRSAKDIETAITALGHQQNGGLIVVPDTFSVQHRASRGPGPTDRVARSNVSSWHQSAPIKSAVGRNLVAQHCLLGLRTTLRKSLRYPLTDARRFDILTTRPAGRRML
jgi:hypothetical protein